MLTESSEITLHATECVNTKGQHVLYLSSEVTDAMQVGQSTFYAQQVTTVHTKNARHSGANFILLLFHSCNFNSQQTQYV